MKAFTVNRRSQVDILYSCVLKSNILNGTYYFTVYYTRKVFTQKKKKSIFFFCNRLKKDTLKKRIPYNFYLK